MNNTFCKNCHRIPSQCVCPKSNNKIKELTLTYTVKLATYTPDAFVAGREKLYELFDEAFFGNADTALGVSFLTNTTELRIEGQEKIPA